MSFNEIHIKDVCGVIRYRPNIKRWLAHDRKEHIIGIQLSGSALHKFDNKHFIISENCIFFLNQKENYKVEVFEKTDAISVHFTTYEDIDIESFSLQINNTVNIVQMLEKIAVSKRKSEILLVYSLLYELINEFQIVVNKFYSPRDNRIVDAKNYIDTHFTDPDCLCRAISRTNLSNRRFNELFKNNYDTTPNKYIILKKNEFAKELLLEKGLTVSEISIICGFSDVYYFSKVFKQYNGISPGKFKANNYHI